MSKPKGRTPPPADEPGRDRDPLIARISDVLSDLAPADAATVLTGLAKLAEREAQRAARRQRLGIAEYLKLEAAQWQMHGPPARWPAATRLRARPWRSLAVELLAGYAQALEYDDPIFDLIAARMPFTEPTNPQAEQEAQRYRRGLLRAARVVELARRFNHAIDADALAAILAETIGEIRPDELPPADLLK